MHYFEHNTPNSWNLMDAFKEVMNRYPEKGFEFHIFKLQRELEDIAHNHRKESLRGKATILLQDWKTLAPSYQGTKPLYCNQGPSKKQTTTPPSIVANHSGKGDQNILYNIDNLEQNQTTIQSGSGVEVNEPQASKIGGDEKDSTLEQQRTTTTQDESGIEEKKRQASDVGGDSSDHDEDFYLDGKNVIWLRKKTKTFSYITPKQYVTSPDKPQINDDDLAILQSSFDVVLSQYHSSRSSPNCKKVYKENMSQQNANKNLNDVPATFTFLEQALDKPLDDIPRYLWTNGYQGTDDEQQNNDMIRHILTDFRINCMVTSSKPTNERTPFAENFIPIFKVFAGKMGLVSFIWCEKGLHANHLLSLCLPGSTPLRSLLDGVGTSIKDKIERILIESSGNDPEHAKDDTLKQMANTSNCLKIEMVKYRSASYDTFLKRQVFGIHFIHDKMTLTSTSMLLPNKYSFIEVRSATIPTTYEQRYDWVKVFELLLKLKTSLIEQERITALLERQRVGLEKVTITVKDATD